MSSPSQPKLKWSRRSFGPIPPFEVLAFRLLRVMAGNDRLMKLLNPLMKPFNVFHPTRHIDPYPLYATLAESGPIVKHRVANAWFVSGFAECEEVLRLSEASVDRTEVMDVFPPYSQLSPKARLFFESWILSMDPPDHTRIRKLVSRAFTPRSMALLEPRVAEIAAKLIADTAGQDSFDIVATFGDKFPIYVIGEMLGLPEADWPWLKDASDEIAKFVDPVIGFDPVEMDAVANEVSDYFSRQIVLRRDHPTDDLIGRLVASEEDGDTLTEIELVSLLALVMGAGHETTTNFFGNSLVALHANTSQRSLLADTPELIENAVEELLRYDAPVQVTARMMAADATVGGHTLAKGDDVNILLGAANRDERRFADADRLKLDRDDPRSLSFGHGVHHCVGAALARMEARVALPMLLDDLGEYTVEDIDWRRSFTLRGPKRLIVRRG